MAIATQPQTGSSLTPALDDGEVFLPSLYQQYIHQTRYARWSDEHGRRETWPETVERYVVFITAQALKNGYEMTVEEIDFIRQSILHCEALCSARALMTAGKAAERDNVATFNCTYSTIDDPRAFDEIMYLLMCGCGCGFSVERQYIAKLPEVPDQIFDIDDVIVISDNRKSWAGSYRRLMALLWAGHVPKWDLSRLRPAGQRLKTFGGRSSGPGPLDELFKYTIDIFRGAAGRRLTSLECHGIVCKIGDIVVAGGVRRCLPGSSLVHTAAGLKRIDQIERGEMVFSDDGYSRVLAQSSVGTCKVLRIRTQGGDIVCTPEHRMAILTDLDGGVEWVEAHEIEPGEDFMKFSREILPGTPQQMPPFSYKRPAMSTTCRDMVVPELDADMAWFLGNFHGDGYVHLTNRETADSNGYVSVACADSVPGQHVKVVEQFRRFGFEPRVKRYDSEACTKPRVSSHQLSLYLSQFKTANTPLEVPEIILRSEPEIRAAYVAGIMDADGGTGNRPVLVAASVYKDYLRQVKALLASLGIVSYTTMNRPARGAWQAIYHLCIKGRDDLALLSQHLGPHSVKLAQCPIRIRVKEQSGYVVPKEMLINSAHVGEFQSGYTAPSARANLSWAKFQDHCGERDFVPLRVEEIEEIDESVECFDIQVKGSECFYVEGMLSHNSALISLSNPSDERMRDAKSGNWAAINPHYRLANNSAVWTEKPDAGRFMREWTALYDSKSGERGIVNREALTAQAAKSGRRKLIDDNGEPYQFGVNPCFVGETLIDTAEGRLRIDALADAYARGEHLPMTFAFDTDDALPVLRQIQKAFVSKMVTELLEVETTKGVVVRCTPEHRFLVRDRRPGDYYVQAKDLKPGDRLQECQVVVNDSVLSVRSIVLDNSVPVYDLTVDRTHNFAVATEGVEHTIVVHNCGEIELRPQGLCNLTEIVVRSTDSLDDIKEKARAGAIMGTLQSTCTEFDYVRPVWRKNAEEERLLGVSLGGEMDHPVFVANDEISDQWKRELRDVVNETNVKWAEKLGIPVSAATTCQKPSGTISQLVNSSSGGHARYAPYYVRRTRDSKFDPVAEVVQMSGVPCEQDVYKDENWVFEWPIKAPVGALTTSETTALQQLERWLSTREHFCEHNPSATIHVKEDEWVAVGAWVYDHFNQIGGLAFLPADGAHSYRQTPFEEIDREEYERRVAEMPDLIDWSLLSHLEHDDNTTGSRELACSVGGCDLSDNDLVAR